MVNKGFQKQGLLAFCIVTMVISTSYLCFAVQSSQHSAEIATASNFLATVLYQGQRLRWDFSNHTPLTACISVPINRTHDVGMWAPPLVTKTIQQWLVALPEAQKNTLQVVSCNQAQIRITFLPTLDANYTVGKTIETKEKKGFTAAITTPVFSATTGKLTAMTMKVALNKPTGVPQSTQLLSSVLLHEIGHALGLLGHSPNPNDVMAAAYYNRAGSQTKLKLSASDVATLQVLYGQPAQWSNTVSGAGLRNNQAIANRQLALPTLRTEAKTVGLALQWQNLGSALLWLGQQKEGITEAKRMAYLEEAVGAFNQALTLEPTVSTVAIKLAQTYQLLKQLDAAQTVLAKALRANPLCTNCYLEQAWINAKLKQWTLVKQALLKARQVNVNVVQQPAYQKIQQLLLVSTSPAT